MTKRLVKRHVKPLPSIGQSGFILWSLQVLLLQIIIQNLYTCFSCPLGVFGIFVLDQNFQFLFGNGGESLSHICKILTALHGRGDFELDMITQYLLQILGYHVKFTCYCILTEFSRPIRCFKVILMYNNDYYRHKVNCFRSDL